MAPQQLPTPCWKITPCCAVLSRWLHATCHATVGPHSSPHAQHSSQTKLLWQFLKPPTQVAATSFPSQPATVYVERHTTQHQLCLPRGLHKPKHKGNQSPAPILHVTVLVRTSWPRCEVWVPRTNFPTKSHHCSTEATKAIGISYDAYHVLTASSVYFSVPRSYLQHSRIWCHPLMSTSWV